MTDYDNRNSGLLFKSTSDHHKAPAYSGFWTDANNNQIKIKAYWSKNPDKNGNNFLQISVDTYEKTDRPTGKNSPAWQAQREKFKKDEIKDEDIEEISNEDLLNSIPF